MKTEVINPMKADKDRRTALRTSMRFITRSLGQVTNSKETIIRVVSLLNVSTESRSDVQTASIHEKLAEQLPSPPSSSSPAMLDSSIPLPYAYLLSHLSKGLIKQAESEVSAKAEAAFPLARVVVGLLLRGHAALSDVLFARLVKKCPWVIPFYPSKLPVS
jgi:nucleoporin GLE1